MRGGTVGRACYFREAIRLRFAQRGDRAFEQRMLVIAVPSGPERSRAVPSGPEPASGPERPERPEWP